jgi:tetratricopeptide (TPR) repeat protein
VVFKSPEWCVSRSGLSRQANGGIFAVYALPATRLAVLAVTEQDAVGAFMAQWYGLQKLLDQHWRALQTERDLATEPRERAIAAFVVAEEQFRGFGCYWLNRGLLRVLVGDYGAAEADLQVAVSHAVQSPEERAYAFYNLACAQTRLGKVDEARESLTEALRRREGFGGGLAADPDFEGVRDETWFQMLLPESDAASSVA